MDKQQRAKVLDLELDSSSVPASPALWDDVDGSGLGGSGTGGGDSDDEFNTTDSIGGVGVVGGTQTSQVYNNMSYYTARSGGSSEDISSESDIDTSGLVIEGMGIGGITTTTNTNTTAITNNTAGSTTSSSSVVPVPPTQSKPVSQLETSPRRAVRYVEPSGSSSDIGGSGSDGGVVTREDIMNQLSSARERIEALGVEVSQNNIDDDDDEDKSA